MPDISPAVQKHKEHSQQSHLSHSRSSTKESHMPSKSSKNKLQCDTVELSHPAKKLLESMREEKMKS